MGGSPPLSLLEATNNTTGLLQETFTSQPDSSVCRDTDWYVEQFIVLPLTAIAMYNSTVDITTQINSMYTPISEH